MCIIFYYIKNSQKHLTNVKPQNAYGCNIGQIQKFQPSNVSNLLPSKRKASSHWQALITRLPEPATKMLIVMPI
jgi:hypothetical protein